MKSSRSTILLMLASIALIAAPAANAAESWHVSTVRFVYPQGDGSFVLGFTADPAACPNTNSPKYFRIVAGQNGVTADGVKAMLATSLAAYSLGKAVSIAFDDATGNCYINRLSVQD